MSAKTAKILTIRIYLRGLGNQRRLATRIRTSSFAATVGAIGSAQCPEVDRLAAFPKEGSLAYSTGLSCGRRTSGYNARIVDAIGIAIRSAQGAEIGDGVVGRVGGLCTGGQRQP